MTDIRNQSDDELPVNGMKAWSSGDLGSVLHDLMGSVVDIHLRLDSALDGDRSYKEAAAGRAVRITELLTENMELKRQLASVRDLEAASSDSAPSSEPALQAALESIRMAEERIVMLEKSVNRAERQYERLHAAHSRLRQRKAVRAALKLAEPLVIARRILRRSGGVRA